MTKSTTETILDDDAIAEIAKRDWHLNGALEKRIALSPAERDGLVAMVRMFNEHYENLMRAALLREQNAATSMRSRCVEKVRAKAKRERELGAEYNVIRAIAFESLAADLESLSIQEQEK